MTQPAKPSARISGVHRPVIPGRSALATAASAIVRPTLAAHGQGIASSHVPQQTIAPCQANRNAIQSRGVGPQASVNRSGNAVNQRPPNRPAAPVPSKVANYTVQSPLHLGGRSQQIRATIQGTPQVAGSVEISSAGAGRVYISNLKVEQQHRRHGIAAKLIDAAINTARRQGFSAASLEARPSDNGITPQGLVAMYRRKGFKSVGKSGRGSPLMERKL